MSMKPREVQRPWQALWRGGTPAARRARSVSGDGGGRGLK